MSVALAAKIAADDFVLFEDDDSTRRRITDLLSAKGCDVHIARTINDVLDYQEQGAQCFILDLAVQRQTDGLEALELIKRKDTNAFVAILTSHPRYTSEAARLGASLYQVKSVDLARDLDAIYQRMRTTEVERDADHQAFRELMAVPEWVGRNEGKFVGIVNGKLVAVLPDRNGLLEFLNREYPNTPKYYGKVENKETVLHLPTPFPTW